MAMPTGPGDLFQAWALELGLLLADQTTDPEVSLALLEDLESALWVIRGDEDVDANLRVMDAVRFGGAHALPARVEW